GLGVVTSNKVCGGQEVVGSNNLVVAGREQEKWASYLREVNRASERCKAASRKLVVLIEPLNDLEIIGAGEIDGACVPFAKARDQRRAARHIIRNLQQIMNCLGFERWMFPELGKDIGTELTMAGHATSRRRIIDHIRTPRASARSWTKYLGGWLLP